MPGVRPQPLLVKDPWGRRKDSRQKEHPDKTDFMLQNGNFLCRNKFHYNKAAFQNSSLSAEVCSFSKYSSWTMPKKYMNRWRARFCTFYCFSLQYQFCATEISQKDRDIAPEFCVSMCALTFDLVFKGAMWLSITLSSKPSTQQVYYLIVFSAI